MTRVLGALTLAVTLWVAAPCVALAQERVQSSAEPTVRGANTANDVAVGGNVDDSFSIYGMPIPIVDPTIGNGVAPAVLTTFRLDPDDKVSPRSSFAAAVGYTDTKSYAAGGNLKLYLGEDRYRLDMLGGYGSFNIKFYGVGSDSVLQNHPLDFNLRGSFVSATGTVRVADHVYVGPTAKYFDAQAHFGFLEPVVPDNELNVKLAGLGIVGQYDSRDTEFSPHEGILAEAELVRFDGAIGSDFSFLNFDSQASYYLEVVPDLVLATNARFAVAGHAAPFFALPFVSLRGFAAGQHLDQTVWQSQAELRWRIFWRIGVVGFFGVGQAAGGVEDFGHSELLYAGGAGIRFIASEAERVTLGLDYARSSDDDSAVYFRIGEAF